MQTPIVHEFKELGTLQLESGKTIDSAGFENYWMRANFEALVTGATYCTVVDDYIIRRYCTILSSDPDLLDDFLIVKPNINVLPQAVMAEFTLRLGSKTYGFIVQIPKFTPEGSLAEVVQLHQKNNVLVRRIKTLEEQIMKQEINDIMFADLGISLILKNNGVNNTDTDGYLQRCIEIAGDIAESHHYDSMIEHVKCSKMGIRLLAVVKTEKLLKLKDYLINKRKIMYLYIIGDEINIFYIDTI